MPHELTAYLFVFDLFSTHEIAILSKGPTNIRGLCSNFVECESFLESNSPDILAPCETNLDDSIDFGDFFVKVLSSFNPRGFCYSYTWSCSFCEGRAFFCTGLISRKICGFLLMCPTGFAIFSVLHLFPISITFFLFMNHF